MKCGKQEEILGISRPCSLAFEVLMRIYRNNRDKYGISQGDIHIRDEFTLAFAIQNPNPEDKKEYIVLGECGVKSGEVYEEWLPASV